MEWLRKNIFKNSFIFFLRGGGWVVGGYRIIKYGDLRIVWDKDEL